MVARCTFPLLWVFPPLTNQANSDIWMIDAHGGWRMARRRLPQPPILSTTHQFTSVGVCSFHSIACVTCTRASPRSSRMIGFVCGMRRRGVMVGRRGRRGARLIRVQFPANKRIPMGKKP